MDTITSEQRSRNMSAIRSKNTRPEIYFRKLLFEHGYRYRLNSKRVPGHPDIYLKKYNTAIFIHGCFWHRHEGCQYAYMPKSRGEFWQKKFETNQKRDAFVKEELLSKNVKCLIVWECTLKTMAKDSRKKDEIIRLTEYFLRTNELFAEL